MKLIPESNDFEALKLLLNFDTVEGRVLSRLESYSCKLVGQEKALYKKFSSSVTQGMNELEVLSPTKEEEECPLTPIGCNSFDLLYRNKSEPIPSRRRTTSLSVPASFNTSSSSSSVSCSAGIDSESEGSIGDEDRILRKTLFYLVSTLNAAFYPDYDFSSTSAWEFSREHSSKQVMKAIEQKLVYVSRTELAGVAEKLYKAIDAAAILKDCEIYTYNPDDVSDPYSDDCCLWSFNYFFYNPRLRRMVFLSSQLMSRRKEQDMQSDYEMDFNEDYEE